VQHSLSDDYGLVDFDIIERSVDYRLYFYDTNNNLIQNTTSLKFVCTSMLCELTYLLSPVSTSPSMPDVSVSFVYDNSTDFIHLNWTDTEGRTRTVSTVIKSMSGISDTIICNISQVGTGGNVSCNISGYSGDIHTDVYVIGSLYSIFSRIITVVGDFFSGLSEWKPAEGAFWSMFIMVPIVLSAVFSPVAVIVSSIIGLIAIKSLHLLSIVTTAFIGVAALIGIVISLRMRR
jgi:hypothetical protein